MAIPTGQSVPLVIVPQTVALSVNLGTLVVAEGSRMMANDENEDVHGRADWQLHCARSTKSASMR